MKLNRTYAALVSMGAVIGTVGVIALQTHAQQSATAPAPQVQTQTSARVVSADAAAGQDTDNVQDSGNVEKPDTAGAQTEVTDTDAETNDDQGQKPDAPGTDTETQDDATGSAK